MSYVGLHATRWAWSVPVSSSSERLVLLALAKHDSDDDELPYPSAETIAKETRLNRKTVFSAIASLCEAGFIVRSAKTGQGRRNQYELNFNRTENGTMNAPKTERTEIGTYQKRDVPKTGHSTSQKRDDERTENGTLNVPFTGHEYRREERREKRSEERSFMSSPDDENPRIDTNPNAEPIDDVPFPDFEDQTAEELFDAPLVDEAKPRDEPQPEAKPKPRTRKASAKKAADWPVEDDGVDAETREAYLAVRKAKRVGPFTPKAYEQLAKQATKHGVSVKVALEKCIERGWIFPYDGAFEKEKNYGKTQQSQQKSAFLRPQSEIDYTYGLDRWNRA